MCDSTAETSNTSDSLPERIQIPCHIFVVRFVGWIHQNKSTAAAHILRVQHAAARSSGRMSKDKSLKSLCKDLLCRLWLGKSPVSFSLSLYECGFKQVPVPVSWELSVEIQFPWHDCSLHMSCVFVDQLSWKKISKVFLSSQLISLDCLKLAHVLGTTCQIWLHSREHSQPPHISKTHISQIKLLQASAKATSMSFPGESQQWQES